MPGICGIVRQKADTALGKELSSMVECLRLHDWYIVEQHVATTGDVGMSRVALGLTDRTPQPARSADGRRVAFVEGELYESSGERATSTSAGANGKSHGAAAVVLDALTDSGPRGLDQLDGSFAACVWDEPARSLSLISDRFGSRPVYYAHQPGQLLFASSLRAIVRQGDVPPTIDPRGIAQFFTFGQYLGDDTSVAGVKVLPAGSVLRYDAEADRVVIESYLSQRAADVLNVPGDSPSCLDEIDEAFAAAVARRTCGPERIGVALSGGLDARTILAVIGQTAQPVTSICYSVKGSLDDRCSRRMAGLVGSPYRHYELGSSFLAEYPRHLDEMVRLTDGQYLSQCIMIPTLRLYRELGLAALLRGHAGELLHMHKAYAYSVDDEALALRDDAALENWVFRRLRAYLLESVDGPLFRGSLQASIDDLARESLRECLAPLAGMQPVPQRIWQLFLDQRLRRETALSMVKFRSVVEPRLPYLDRQLVDLLMRLPPQRKVSDDIQAYILRKRRPEFLTVVNANTGTTLGAGRLRTRLSILRMRAFSKLGVPGYRPYERLGLWLRRELTPMVRSILLSDECRDRGLFVPETVQRVVEQHIAGARNHTYLLIAMLVVELGQRLLTGAPEASRVGEARRLAEATP